MRVGDKIKLTQKMNGEIFNGEYRGIDVGTEGTILKISDFGNGETKLEVNWENGRTLGVILPEDKIQITEEHNYFEEPLCDEHFIEIARDVYGNSVRDNSKQELIDLGKKYHITGEE